MWSYHPGLVNQTFRPGLWLLSDWHTHRDTEAWVGAAGAAISAQSFLLLPFITALVFTHIPSSVFQNLTNDKSSQYPSDKFPFYSRELASFLLFPVWRLLTDTMWSFLVFSYLSSYLNFFLGVQASLIQIVFLTQRQWKYSPKIINVDYLFKTYQNE